MHKQKQTICWVAKRDGRKQAFDQKKIARAIGEAGKATTTFQQAEAEKLAARAVEILVFEQNPAPSVEHIQDVVEGVLMNSPYQRAAKAYILYRDQHRAIREFAERSHVDLVDGYLEKSDWQVKENSNMSFSLQGLNNYLATEVSKTYWLNSIYPENVRTAHREGDFHIHDLGDLSVYCVGWDLYDLLMEGFTGVSGKIESAPAKHLRTALGQMVNFMYTLQGETAGAIAFSNFDTLLAPFVRSDKLSYNEVKQAMQEFIFNMNVPTRVGFQTPFSNITLDLTPSPNFKDSPVVIGGETQEEKYGDFQKEMDMLNEAFFEVMAEGDASGRVFTFPIPTVNITNDFDYDRPQYKNLWNITGKYGIPYFSNFVGSDMKPEDTRSMCCRLRLDVKELGKRGGGLFGANALTGSVGVVTINMPRLGYIATSKEDFKNRLADLMDIAKESLEIKRKVLERFTENGLYPYTKHYLRKIKERDGSYWSNHFSTIGLVGMNEAGLNLLGSSMGDSEGRAFGLEILDFMRERLVAYQQETSNLYNLEATPAEGTSYRLAKRDVEKYPGIKVANYEAYQKGAEPFYTNSSHLPVSYTDDIFENLDLQDELQTKYTGGTVIHLFAGEKISDHRTITSLIKKICSQYQLPYFSITPTFSVCQRHGYIAGEHPRCPTCESACEVYSRVVGYLRPVQQWNVGKQAEFAERKTYTIPPRAKAGMSYDNRSTAKVYAD
jgi:ribonucleoside-triphosphate reductase (formate)